MHYGNGALTRCRDVLDSEFEHCSDLNTSRFLKRMIEAEKPDFIAFTGAVFYLFLISRFPWKFTDWFGFLVFSFQVLLFVKIFSSLFLLFYLLMVVDVNLLRG